MARTASEIIHWGGKLPTGGRVYHRHPGSRDSSLQSKVCRDAHRGQVPASEKHFHTGKNSVWTKGFTADILGHGTSPRNATIAGEVNVARLAVENPSVGGKLRNA